jgi:hypothetical protein
MRDPNSFRAWRRIQDDGRLTASRRRAFEALCRRGPCTAQELVRFSGYQHAEKRLSELERQGMVTRLESVTCSITGERAATWEVIPDATPIPLEKPTLTNAQRIAALEQAVEELQERVFQLEQKPPPPAAPSQGSLW